MKRLILDFVLAAIFFAAMLYLFLPKMLHEVLGVVMFAAVVYHLRLNGNWFGNFLKGRQTASRIVMSLVDWLLIAAFLVVTVSGIALSNHLFRDFLPLWLHRSILLRQLHVAAPYAMLILIGLHIGFHWRGMAAKILPTLLRGKFGAILALLFAAVGVYGSFLDRVGNRLMMKHIFGTPATSLSPTAYAALIFGEIALYAVVGFWTMTFFRRKR